MENKSEYGIYEEFLKNFDSVNYKNKDSSTINNEFQKVISELCEKDMINVALQAELDRQVFFVILENFCYCLIQKALGELPDFEVMTWQLCNLLRSTLNCLQGTLILLQR